MQREIGKIGHRPKGESGSWGWKRRRISLKKFANGIHYYRVEPADESLETARNHAKAEGLPITYTKVRANNSRMPIVLWRCILLRCIEMCDLPKVISEISRVLKPGGVFIYDTLNRTFVSKVVAIKMARLEEVGFYAAQPACLENVYQTRRNKGTLSRNALRWQDHTGSQPNVSIPKMLGYLRKRVKGEWTFAELGKNFWLVESKDMNILYGGHAIKGWW